YRWPPRLRHTTGNPAEGGRRMAKRTTPGLLAARSGRPRRYCPTTRFVRTIQPWPPSCPGRHRQLKRAHAGSAPAPATILTPTRDSPDLDTTGLDLGLFIFTGCGLIVTATEPTDDYTGGDHDDERRQRPRRHICRPFGDFFLDREFGVGGVSHAQESGQTVRAVKTQEQDTDQHE